MLHDKLGTCTKVFGSRVLDDAEWSCGDRTVWLESVCIATAGKRNVYVAVCPGAGNFISCNSGLLSCQSKLKTDDGVTT